MLSNSSSVSRAEGLAQVVVEIRELLDGAAFDREVAQIAATAPRSSRSARATRGSASMRRTCFRSTAGSCSLLRTASDSSSSSGMLLHRKNDEPRCELHVGEPMHFAGLGVRRDRARSGTRTRAREDACAAPSRSRRRSPCLRAPARRSPSASTVCSRSIGWRYARVASVSMIFARAARPRRPRPSAGSTKIFLRVGVSPMPVTLQRPRHAHAREVRHERPVGIAVDRGLEQAELERLNHVFDRRVIPLDERRGDRVRSGGDGHAGSRARLRPS